MFSLVSCSGEEVETTSAVSDQTDQATAPVTEPLSSDIILIDSGNEDYAVVRCEFADDYEINSAVALKNALLTKFKTVFDNVIASDYVNGNNKNETVDVPGREILVGDTNRRQSRDIKAKLERNEYVITVVDDKLVIVGENPYATSDAVAYFIENVVNKSQKEDEFTLSRDFYYKGAREEDRPPLAEGATLRFLSWNLGCGVGVESEIVYVLNQYMPDVIGLQESNAEIHSDAINPFINSHKEYKHAKSNHASGTLNYTPIIYNSSKLDLVESNVEWLRGRYTGTNTKSVCWAVFDEKGGGRFAMINFHGAVCNNSYKGYENMSSDELSAVASAWRLDNVKQILEIRDSIIAKYGAIPMTVNGDCNFAYSTAPYNNLINAGFIDAELRAEKRGIYGFKTSYKYENGLPSTGNSIDHIFGIDGVRFVYFSVIRSEHVAKATDHCPIFVDYCPSVKQ